MSYYSVSVIFLFILCIKLTVSAPMQDTLGRRSREKGCYYLSNHYDNGERIVTNEPCLNCTCLNSMLMCYLRICPFIKPVGEECIIERDEGDCCPKIWCPEVINEKKCDDPSHDEKHTHHPGCYLDDKYYPDGAQLPRDPKRPCEVCYCIRNSTACVMQECELKVEGCSPVYKEGQCCPCRYNCTYEESTTAPPGVTLQELAEGCNLPDGTFVEDGEAVNSTNPCEHCYCMRNEVVCAIQECQAPGDDCKPLPPKPDQCCPDRYECPVLQSPESSSIHPEKTLSFTTVFSTSAEISTELAPIKHSGIKGSSQKGIEAGKYSPSSSVKGAPSKVSYDQETTSQSLTDDYAQTDKPSLEIVNLDKAVSKPQPEKKSGIKGGSKTITSTSTPPHELAVLSESDDNSGDQFNDSDETLFTVKETQITSKTPVDDYSVKPSSGTAIKGFGVKGGVSEKIHSAASVSEVSPDSSTSTTEFYGKESTTHVPLEEHIERNVTEISSEVTTQISLESISDGKVTSKIFAEEETPKPSLKPSGVKGVQSEATSDPESNIHLPSFKPIGVKGVPAKVDDTSTQKKPAIKHVGVKGTPQEEHHFRVKGKQPIHADSLRRRPILPIGAIPGEIRRSTVAPVTKDGIEKLPPILSVPGEGICRVGDIVYQNGQVMKPIHVCKKDCRCINSVILCSDVICNEPEEKNVSYCRIIQEADECCPRYECDNFGSIENISLPVTTTNETQDKEVLFDGHLFGNKTSPIDSDEEILERNLTTTSIWQSTLDLITSTISDKLFDFTKVVTDQPGNVSETVISEFISLTTAPPQKSNQTVSETEVTEIPSTSADILAAGDKMTLHINTEETFETSSWSPESSTHALVEDETTLSDSPKEISEISSLITEGSGDMSAGSTLSLNISVEEVKQPLTSFTEIPTETIKGDITQSISTDESSHSSSVTEASKDTFTEEKQKLTPDISIEEISKTTAHITEVPEAASTGIPPLNISIEEISQTTANITELPIETSTGIPTLNISTEEAAQTLPSTEVQRDTLFEEKESTTYSLPHISDHIPIVGKINDSYENASKISHVFDAEETIHVTENNVSIPVSVTNPTTVESTYETYTTIKYSSDPTPVTFNLSTVIPFEETETKDASIISLKTSTLPTSLSESSKSDFEITSSVLEADKHSDAVDDKAYQTVISVTATETSALTEIPDVSDVEISTSSKKPEVSETFYTTLQDIKSQPPIDNFPEILTSTKLSFEDIENISEEVSNDTEVYDVTPQTGSSKSESTTYKTETIENEAFSPKQTTTVSTTAASESVDTTKIEIVTSDTVASNESTPFVEEKHSVEVVTKLSTTSPQVPGISEKPEVTTEIFPEQDVIQTTEVSEILKFDKLSTASETITTPNQTVKPLVEDSEEATEYFVTEYLPSAQSTQVDIIGEKSTAEKVSHDEETKSILTTISPSKISDFTTVKGETSQDINTDVRITSETKHTSTIATDIDSELSTLHFETSTETALSDSDSVSEIASSAASVTNESHDGDIYRDSTTYIEIGDTEDLQDITDSAEVHTLDSSILGSQPTDLTEIKEDYGIKISTISLTPDIETSAGFSDFLESSSSYKPFNVTISEVKEHSKPVHDTFSETKEPFLIKDKSSSGITEQEFVSYTSTTLTLDETASETTTISSDSAKYSTSETVTDKEYQKSGITGDINAELTDSPSTHETAHDPTKHLSPEIVDQFVTQKESTSSGKEIINTSTGAETEIITEKTTDLPEAPSSHSDDVIDETTAFYLNISTENIMKEEEVKHIPENLILELGSQSEQGIASTASVDEYVSKEKENGTVSFEQPVTSYESFDERKTEPVVTGKNISSVFAVNETISKNSTFIEYTTTEYVHKLETTTKLPEIHDVVHEIKSDLSPFSVTIASELEPQTDNNALQNVSFTEYITELTSVDKTVPKVQEKETGSKVRTTTAESFWHEGTSESMTSFLGLTETVVSKEDSEESVSTKTTDFIDIALISTTKKPVYHFESTESTVLLTKPNIINDTHLITIPASSQDVNTVHNETVKIPEQISESGAANASETIATQLNTDAISSENGERSNVSSVNYDLSTLGSETDFPEEASEYDERLTTEKDLKDALSYPSDAEEESDIRLITSVIPDVEVIISKENQTISDDRQFTTVYEIKNAFNDSTEISTETEFLTTSTQASSNKSTFQISEKNVSTESSFIIQTSETESITQPSKEVYSTYVTGDEFEIHTLKDEIITQVSHRINTQTSTESSKAESETSTEDSVTQKSTIDFATDELQDKFEIQSPKGETVTSASDKEVTTQFVKVKFETQTLVDGLVTKDELITDVTKEEIKAHVLKDEFTDSSEEEFTTQTLKSESEFAISSQQGIHIGSTEEEFTTHPSEDISSTHTQEDDLVTQDSNIESSTIVSKGEFPTQPSEDEFIIYTLKKDVAPHIVTDFETQSTKSEVTLQTTQEKFTTQTVNEQFVTESSKKGSSDAQEEKFATESLEEESSSNAPKEQFVTESSLEESSDAPKGEFSTESSQEKSSSDVPKEKFATESTKQESSFNASKETFVTESSTEKSSDSSKEEFGTESSKEKFPTESTKEESSSNVPKENFATEFSTEESSNAPKEEFGTESQGGKSSSDAPAEQFSTELLKEKNPDASKGELATEVSNENDFVQTTKKELDPQTSQDEPITETSKAAFVTEISSEEFTPQETKDVFPIKISTEEFSTQVTELSETSKTDYEHNTKFTAPSNMLPTGSESAENISTETSSKVPDISASILEVKLTESDLEVETSMGIKDYTITLVPDNVETETTKKISNLPTDFIQPESITSKSTVTYPPRDYTTLSLDENVKVVFVENTTGKFPEILSVIKVSHEEPPPKIDGSLSKFDTTDDSLSGSYSPTSEDKLVHDDFTNSTFDVTEATVHSESNKDSFQETTSVIDDKLTSVKTDNVDIPITSLNLTNLNESKSSLSDDTSASSIETTFTVTSTPSKAGIAIKASTDATDESVQQEILKTQTTEEFSVIEKNISSESTKTAEFEDQLFTKSTDLKHVTSQPILPGLTEVISDGLSTTVSVTITQDQSEGSSDSENFKDSHFSEESGIPDHPSTDIYLLQSTKTSGESETHTYSTESDILVDGAHSSYASESSVFGVDEEDSSPIYTEIPLDIKDLKTANSMFPQDVKFQQTTVSFSFDNKMSHDGTQQEKHVGTFIPDRDLTGLSEIITSDSATSEIPHLATNITQAANETKEVQKHKEASPHVTPQDLINSSSTDFSVSSPAYENFSQTQDVETSTEKEILIEQAVHSTKLFTTINEADKDVSSNAAVSIGSSVTDNLLPITVSVSPSNDVFEIIDGASPIPTNDSLDNEELETEISIEITDENQTQNDLLENTSDEFDVSTSYTEHDLPLNATIIQPSIETTFKEIFEDLSEHSSQEIDAYTGTPGGSTEIKSNTLSAVEINKNISSTDIKEYGTSSKLPTDVVTEEIIDLFKTTMSQEKESIPSFAGTSSEIITQNPLTEERLPTVESHSESYIDEKRTISTTEEFQDNALLGIQTTTEKDTGINVKEVEAKVTEGVSSTSPAETEEKYEFSTSSYDNETNLDFTQSSETGDITEPKVTETVHEVSTDISVLPSVTDTSSRTTETSSVTSTTPTLLVRDIEPQENETYSQTGGTAVHVTSKSIKDYVLQKNLTETAVTTPFSETTASDSSESSTTVKNSELLSTVVSHLTESTLTDTQPTRTANISDESSFILQLNDSASEIPHTFGTEEITSFISTDFPEDGKHRSPEVSSVSSAQTDQGTKAPFTTPVHTDLLETVSEIFDQSSPVSIISETHGSFESQYSTPSSGFDQEDSQHPLQEEGICFYEGHIFQSAKQIPRRDPCEFCFCFRGDIICLQQSCPPPIRDCFATPIQGFCCPRFHCPVQEMHFNLSTTTTTTAKPKLGHILQKTVAATGCEIDGKVYRVNQLVRPASGPCMQCRCEYGGIMKCDPKDCQPQAPLLLRLNKEFFRK